MDRRIVTVDWVSRLFSVVGVLGTLGIGMYLYNDARDPALVTVVDERLKTPLQEMEAIKADLAAQKQSIADQIRTAVDDEITIRDADLTNQLTDLNQRVTDGLRGVEDDARDMLAAWDKKIADWNDEAVNRQLAREQTLDRVLAEIRSTAELDAGPLLNSPDRDVAANQSEETEYRAVLALRNPVPSISGEKDADTDEITIENTGDRSATITTLTFRPTNTYKLSSVDATVNARDSTVIVFASEDNRATVDGQHKDYSKVLSRPVIIPAGDSIAIQLEIDNRKHLGWGFEGTLTLSHDDGTLEVKTARARFVDRSGSDI